MRILITGGAGFVGSRLALGLKRDRPGDEVLAFDNLHRRGSELAPHRLRGAGVRFVHGDVRSREDLAALGALDVLVECSAEPSVRAGRDGDARYVVDTNLLGTLNCLELARAHGAGLVFLSSSRVHPIEALRSLPLFQDGDRLRIEPGRRGPGWSERGIARGFPLEGRRSLYGATKLCSELLIQEYVGSFGVRAVVDRCGVIAGPGQMGHVDQGFVALWAARHLFGGPLAYRGFGGRGLQVRDVLHVDDLHDLVALQIDDLDRHAGALYAVGGGPERSVSLRELSRLCAGLLGRSLEIGCEPETDASDIPYHVTDIEEVTARTGWKPRRSLDRTVADVFHWLEEGRRELEPFFR
jgi:CDP-paratose 2-epimerase